jgi:hypothetical protein
MSIGDYILDSVLVLLVFRQLRESRLDRRALLLPLAIVAFVAHEYLHNVPTSGNDLVLIVALTAVGVALGTGSGLVTRVRADGGRYPLVKAGYASAALWVLGMGSRFAFAIWANNGGAETLGHFSAAHDITSGDAWTAALVLMALGEVISRVGVLYLRGRRVLATYHDEQQSANAGLCLTA